MSQQEQAANAVPAYPGLFTEAQDGVHLMSARCGDCGTHFFPKNHQQHRPGCSRGPVDEVLLHRKGKLASFTTLHYMPPKPFKTEKDITPFPMGMVEFPEGIQVVGIITDCSQDDLKMGMEMETVAYTLYRNEDGQRVQTWGFRPVK
ncbi:MAG: OB-fold domain-containing protein [Desulfarculus sp.]|nr:OB-fold domain-containing protein [Pseudomonadota bacterium]MBU4574273.1 OB-fold domain-containing protein [Pseudomonadota bacterium]MBU4596283.1 OB-fold domain-containing protein [Pseudomonadota bacterium]MBV1715370.1 OB-fold domain-containing protein [Desulfarculus sp.]MBV1737565.1 OB-fold domain-containing protein [Desulfarculus sp.]